MAAQFLTISRLSNIIHMIGLGRQSGILRVVRGQGPTREIGQIKFIDGEPVSALLGQLTGPNALTVLSNWGECIYSFDEQPVPEGGDADLAAEAINRLSSDPSWKSPTSGLPSGSWPAYGYATSNPMPGAGSLPPMSSPTGPSLPDYGMQPGYGGYSASYAPQPGPSTPPGGMAYDGRGTATRQAPMPGVQVNEPLSPEQMALRPRRTYVAERVEQLPLDRRERMVVLLVDGRRTLSDLARLTRRTEREVLAVLNHLAGLGLVQLEG